MPRRVTLQAAPAASLVGAASADALPGPLQRALGGLVQSQATLELPGRTGDEGAPADAVAPPASSAQDRPAGEGPTRDRDTGDAAAGGSDADLPDSDLADDDAVESAGTGSGVGDRRTVDASGSDQPDGDGDPAS